MCEQEKGMINRMKRLEDNLLRSKDFNEQLKMHYILLGYSKKLQEIKYQKKD